MNWFKELKFGYKTSQSDTFQDWFGKEMDKSKGVKVVSKDKPFYKTITLTLYRGFDANIDSLKQVNGNYILSPKKSEQGVLWFSQYLRDAQGRGKYILEYPLEGVKKHLQKIHYSDGHESEMTPQEILDQSKPTENSKIWQGYELPEGWLFSYKTQKFIIRTEDLIVAPNMIKRDEEYELV